MTKKDQNGTGRDPGNSDEAVAAARAAGPAYDEQQQGQDVDTISEEAMEEALSKEAAPIFNTHSTALAGKMMAEGKAYIAQVADVDAKIAAMQAEREDLMLAYSMLSHGMQAREKGQR